MQEISRDARPDEVLKNVLLLSFIHWSSETVCVCVVVQVVILERRNAAGKALFKPVTAWNGSEDDKQRLLDELERLQKDPSILVHDAVLPELNNEFASVSSL